MSAINTINRKPCNYNCGTRIYQNPSENAYFKVFTKKKHIHPNRSNYTNKRLIIAVPPSTTVVSKQNYYKKPFANQANKPKMSNSFELLTGSIGEVQRKYEYLSDIVTEYNGKVHVSQRDRDPKTGLMDLLVYYEVPLGKREEVKRKFENFTRNQQVALQQRNY